MLFFSSQDPYESANCENRLSVSAGDFRNDFEKFEVFILVEVDKHFIDSKMSI
jgi:hypothetical protein